MSDNIAIMEKRIELIKSIKDAGLNFEQASILFQINEKDNTPEPKPNPAPTPAPATAPVVPPTTPAPATAPVVPPTTPAPQPTVPPVAPNTVVEGNPLTNILFGNN